MTDPRNEVKHERLVGEKGGGVFVATDNGESMAREWIERLDANNTEWTTTIAKRHDWRNITRAELQIQIMRHRYPTDSKWDGAFVAIQERG